MESTRHLEKTVVKPVVLFKLELFFSRSDFFFRNEKPRKSLLKLIKFPKLHHYRA